MENKYNLLFSIGHYYKDEIYFFLLYCYFTKNMLSKNRKFSFSFFLTSKSSQHIFIGCGKLGFQNYLDVVMATTKDAN